MTNKRKQRQKTWFPSSRALECHVKNCLAINHKKLVLLLIEGQYVNFQNFKRLNKAPFIIYGLIPLADNADFGPNTKKYQDHIVCRYGYKLMCADEWYSKPYKTYFGEDVIDKLSNDMIKESEYRSKVVETEFSKPLVLTEIDHEDFNNSIKCWIYKKKNMKEVKRSKRS